MTWYRDSSGGLSSHPKGHREEVDKALSDFIAEIEKDEEAAEAPPPPVVVMPAAVVSTDLVKCETFPVTHATEVLTTDDPLDDMKALCRDVLLHKDYLRIRNQYCGLSIKLNFIGKLAPAFRPVLKSGGVWGDKKLHYQVLRDQVVIDLHWCHATKMGFSTTDPNHQALFDDPAVFPFERAYLVACISRTSKYRAAQALCLTTLQQCQLLRLREEALNSRQEALDKGWYESKGKRVSKIAAIKRQISQWAERDKRIASSRDHYEKLWLARELLEPGAKAAQIATLHALMVGSEELDRKTITGKLQNLDKHVKLL